MASTDILPLELNNVIVKMRKLISQAKMRCCQKLNQQIKKLKNSRCAVEEKKNRKIERMSEEIKSLKKLSSDEISKFSLLNTKSFEELTKKPPSISQLALFKISTSGILMKFIDEFRDQHPTWPIEIPFILQRLGLQYKSRKESKETRSKKKNETKKKNSSKIIIKTDDEEKIEEIDKEEQFDENSLKNEKTPSNANLDQIETKIDENLIENSQRIPQLDEIEAKNDENLIENPSKKLKKPKKKTKKLPNDKKTPTVSNETKQNGRFGQMELRRINLTEMSNDEFLPSVSSAGDQNEFFQASKPKKISKQTAAGEFDPFFVQDGDEIQKRPFRTASNEKDDSDDEGSGKNSDRDRGSRKFLRSQFSDSLSGKNVSNRDSSIPRKIRNGKFPTKKQGRNSNPNMVPLGNSRMPMEKPRKIHENFVKHEKLENRRMRRQNLRKEAERKIESETLHPSWQAKRKEKISLVQPAGKKIKFTDDD